jgi:anti-sigma factor RsiW
MVRYLLGELPDEERVQFEDQYANDEECFDQLLAVEDDLIQDYVRNELAPRERRRFEEYFLISPKRRQKVERARVLLQVLQKQKTAAAESSLFKEAIGSVIAWLKSGLNVLLTPNPAISFAILVLGAVIGGRWIYLTTERLQANLGQFEKERAALSQANQELQEQIVEQGKRLDKALQDQNLLHAQLEKRAQEAPMPDTAASAASELRIKRSEKALQDQVNPLAQVHGEQAKSMPDTAASVPSLSTSFTSEPAKSVTFALSPYDGERGAEGGTELLTLVIPRITDSVRLQLELRRDDSPSYRAVLEAMNRDEILWSQEVPPTPSHGRKVVILALPAMILGDGEYTLKLQNINTTGAFEDTDNFYFFRTKRR